MYITLVRVRYIVKEYRELLLIDFYGMKNVKTLNKCCNPSVKSLYPLLSMVGNNYSKSLVKYNYYIVR